MSKEILDTEGIKKIIKNIFLENSHDVEITRYEKKETIDLNEYLDIRFYSFTNSVVDTSDGPQGYDKFVASLGSISKTYALIEKVQEEALLPEDANYNEDNVKITFLMPPTRARVLDRFIKELRAKYLGKYNKIEDGLNACFLFNVLQYDDGPQAGASGRPLKCSLNFKISYTSNVVTSGDKVWALDGAILPYIRESIEIDTSGATNNISGLKATQSLGIKRTRFYRFELPFSNTNAACVQLQKDILGGGASKTYELSYYDGVTYTKENPFISTVSLFRSADSGSEIPKESNFKVTFTDADSITKQDNVTYYLALLDYPFDSTSNNQLYFSSEDKQTKFFFERIEEGTYGVPYQKILAPNLNSLTITQQVYRYDEVSWHSLTDVLSKNYAIIKEVDKIRAKTKYYYYYVKSANVGADNQILVDLEMDTLQSNLFKNGFEIAQCFIESAHEDRFLKIDNNTVKFNNLISSMLFENEKVRDFSKRAIKQTKLKFKYTKFDEVNEWLEDNVSHWVYIYLEKSIDYDLYGVFGRSKGNATSLVVNDLFRIENRNIKNGNISQPLGCICYPSMKNSNVQLRINYTYDNKPCYIMLTSNGFAKFEENNDKSDAFLYNMKISAIPPFNLKNISNYTINDNSLSIELGSFSPGNLVFDGYGLYRQNNEFAVIVTDEFSGQGNAPDPYHAHGLITRIQQQGEPYESYPYKLDRFTFKNLDIIGADKNTKFNPKLNSESFKVLRITTGTGENFDYDMQKIGEDEISFLYTETFQPEITKAYLRIKSPVGIYSEENNTNYLGLVISDDTSISFTKEAYAQFIANNKHFNQQTKLKFLQQGINGVAGSVFGGLLTGNILGAGVGLATTASNLMFGAVNTALTIDNMKNAPDSVVSASGNVRFTAQVKEIGLYVLEYEAIPHELEMANDYMFLNGFTINKVGKFKEYLNKRKYFSYIKAQVELLSGVPMNTATRDDIKRKISQGVRFWNADNFVPYKEISIQYDKENYENSIV